MPCCRHFNTARSLVPHRVEYHECMNSVLRAILDLIFPPSAEERLLRTLTPDIVTSLLAPKIHKDTYSLFPYRDARIKALIWQLKYKGDSKAIQLLVPIMATYLNAHVPGHLLVLPIPLSRTRLYERGYNQVALVARTLAKALPRLTLQEDLLMRAIHNEHQTKLSRLERIRNTRGAFKITNPEALRGKDVLILDDVTTTGATLREAEAVVRACGPKSVRTVTIAY